MLPLKGNMEERAVRLAQYIIENKATVRAAAARFGVSKSTVHAVNSIRVGLLWSLTSPLEVATTLAPLMVSMGGA